MSREQWLLFLLLVVQAGSVTAQRPLSASRMLSTGPEAIMPTIPSVVASGIVHHAAWSLDGRYVLAARDEIRLPPSLEGPPSFVASLVLWDRENSAATEL